jgi:hypothetical protein
VCGSCRRLLRSPDERGWINQLSGVKARALAAYSCTDQATIPDLLKAQGKSVPPGLTKWGYSAVFEVSGVSPKVCASTGLHEVVTGLTWQ